MKRLATAIFAAGLAACTLNGATKTWKGGTLTNGVALWDTQANWDPSGVPAASDDAKFNAAADVVLPNSEVSCNQLLIETDAGVRLSAAGGRSCLALKGITPSYLLPDVRLLLNGVQVKNAGTSSATVLVPANMIIGCSGTVAFSGAGFKFQAKLTSSDALTTVKFLSETRLEGDNSGFRGIVEAEPSVLTFLSANSGSENALWKLSGNVYFNWTASGQTIKFGGLQYVSGVANLGRQYQMRRNYDDAMTLEIGALGGESWLGASATDPVRFYGQDSKNIVLHPSITLRKVGSGKLTLYAYDYARVEVAGGEVIQNVVDLSAKLPRSIVPSHHTLSVSVGNGGVFSGVADTDCPIDALAVAEGGVVHPGTDGVVSAGGGDMTVRLGELNVNTAAFAAGSTLRFTPNAAGCEYAKIIPFGSVTFADAVGIDVVAASQASAPAGAAYTLVTGNASGNVSVPGGWKASFGGGALSISRASPGLCIIIY